jgi:alpha-tubulin suppressor-like RCC1 family protein
MDVWNKQFSCCDTDMLSSIEGPWSPVLQNLATPRRKAISSGKTTASEVSTFEWETNSNQLDIKKLVLGKTGSAAPNGSSSAVSKASDLSQQDKNDDYVQADDEIQQKIDQKLRPSSRDDHDVDNRSHHSSGSPKRSETRKTDGEEEKKSSGSVDGEERKDDDSSSQGSVWENTISDLILSLPSFDYSHFVDGHNDMVSPDDAKMQRKAVTPTSAKASRKKKQNSAFPTIVESPEEKKEIDITDYNPPSFEAEEKFFHGVPLFLSSLSQVRVSKVSANPLGAHVLMISKEALLFTYGLNNHGQLGIGFKSDIRNVNRGFHTTPTLITPLLENGGKAIDCAAGVDHSLVVVATEGRRLQKLQTKPGVAYSDHGADNLRAPDSPCEPCVDGAQPPAKEKEIDERFHFSEKSVQYHQVYGFGRNNFMKLGLVHPSITGNTKDEHADDEVLPRRVALHCTVWPEEDLDESLPSQGIFCIAASAEHSAALIRKATGDIEVSMWGNASLGALGLPLNLDSQGIRGEIARKPSFKKRNVSPLPTTVESLSHRRNINPSSPYPTQMSLGPYCSFVVMSDGKCMSFGFSAEGMLGQAFNKTHTMEPHAVFLPTVKESPSRSRIVSVSAGAFHVVAVSEDGSVYSWGINSNDRLGLGTIDYTDLVNDLPKEKKENLVVIEWVPQKMDVAHKLSKATRKSSLDRSNSKDDSSDGNGSNDPDHRIALACAGYDSSMLVTESGQVLSFGKRSGRLGRGEISSNVNTPQPLYGGLHLFHAKRSDAMVMAPRGARPKLERSASSSLLE